MGWWFLWDWILWKEFTNVVKIEEKDSFKEICLFLLLRWACTLVKISSKKLPIISATFYGKRSLCLDLGISSMAICMMRRVHPTLLSHVSTFYILPSPKLESQSLSHYIISINKLMLCVDERENMKKKIKYKKYI